MFPLASPDLPAPLPGEPAPEGGILYGLNPDSNGIVWWDRWNQHNANSVVLARSGSGKSYFIKLEVLRSLPRSHALSPTHHGLRRPSHHGG
jgi:hypothetical protein